MTIQPALPFPELDPLTADLPLSVWTTGQQDSRTKRRGRYVPASMAHPGKMPPAIARHAIDHYTAPMTWSSTRCAASGPLWWRRSTRDAMAAAIDAGFTPWERCVALLAHVSDDGLTARASFFQLVNTANARKNGQPLHVPAHEEVLILASR